MTAPNTEDIPADGQGGQPADAGSHETDPTKLSEVNKNLNAALAEERKARKEIANKFSEFEAREKSRVEEEEQKKLKAKGDYEKAEESYKVKIADYEKRLAEVEPIASEYSEFLTKQVDEQLAKIPDETDRAFVASLIEGKSSKDKLTLLPKLSERFIPSGGSA